MGCDRMCRLDCCCRWWFCVLWEGGEGGEGDGDGDGDGGGEGEEGWEGGGQERGRRGGKEWKGENGGVEEESVHLPRLCGRNVIVEVELSCGDEIT